MSFAENRATPVSKGELGLDRTRINTKGQIELISESPEREPKIDGGAGFIEYHDNNPDQADIRLSKRKRLSIKAKNLLHIGSDSNAPEPNGPVLADAPDSVSKSRLVSDAPIKEPHTLSDVVHNPVETVKSKVTGTSGHQAAANLVTKEISHGREVELVQAHEEIAHARTDKERLLAIENVGELVKARQDQFVRWTMDRHVTKVRILKKPPESLKPRGGFVIKQTDGKERMDWTSYISHVADYYAERYGAEYIGFTADPPAPTQEVLVPSVERVLVASAPFQEFVMTIRRIYRWENPGETLKYLVTYYTLWLFNLVLPGFLLGVISLILHRKVRPPTIDDLKRDIIRTEDMAKTALSIGEFIEKEGDQRWVDPLIEKVGPWVLIQLSDLANTMEVLRNFYEWRVPNRTGISIGILTVGLLGATFTPIWLLARVATFMMGVIFFGFFPIGSIFPDYRLLVSPVRWVFWKIPSHAEWAIKTLQAQGARQKELDFSPEPQLDTQSGPDPWGYRGAPDMGGEPASNDQPLQSETVKNYGLYGCRRGRLILSSVGVRYESSIGHHEQWSLRYEQIKQMEKITRHVQKTIGRDSGDDMKLFGPDDREYVMLNMKERDQAFSQIIGFSKVTWQVVW